MQIGLGRHRALRIAAVIVAVHHQNWGARRLRFISQSFEPLMARLTSLARFALFLCVYHHLALSFQPKVAARPNGQWRGNNSKNISGFKRFPTSNDDDEDNNTFIDHNCIVKVCE